MAKTDTRELQYWDRWIRSRDKDAADDLLRLYMPLVHYHVQRISAGLPRNIDRGELQSYGLLGLYDALEKFDKERDLKFDTYASFRIRGAILDGLRREDWMPRSIREKSKKIERAAEKIEQEKLGSASMEEVAESCGMKVDEVSQVLSEGLLSNLLSLDDSSPTGKNDYSSAAIEDFRTVLPDTHLIDQENRRALAREIDKLGDNERLVITLFYYEELTLTEIGRVLGLSTSRISQIHSKALFKLRRFLKSPLYD
ncbi:MULTISPECIES: FliA/WhiG family RNA polymerase sigma factor [unclassified Sporolactobacillus]|uniref:FliA/WhiG family RNA polymerase sigma factor n=1 Tax=unclassified Sporolactobacillus TaxID=2628533 RepID=UPI002368CEFA|nr:FliA/WhiG family RNA polymerase sigma factor [Sporolactobacillus sp. CQH2019]MDD9147040.1 FliA/WhiG family RNA polymerase sigma factor [Sporolactobacillus sp. CQH2019]